MTKILFLSFIMLSVTSFAQDSIRDRELSGKISGGLTYHSRSDFMSIGGQLNIGCSWLTKKNKHGLNAKIGHNLYLNYTNFTSDLVPDNGNLSTFNLCFDWSLIFQKTDRHHSLYRFSYPSLGFCVGYHSRVLNGNTSNLSVPGPTIYYSESGTHLGVIFKPLSFSFQLINRIYCYIETPIQLLIINRRNVPTFSVTIGTQFG